MKRNGSKTLKVLLLMAPLILGTVGLYFSGESLLNALFHSITMYGMEYGEDPANWLVQLARWLAPVATAGGVISFITPLVNMIKARFALLFRNSVVVYGDEEAADGMAASGRYRVLKGESRLLPAKKYILLWDESTNIAFYRKYQEKLKKREVYFRCEALRSQDTADAHLHPICPEETGARLYWKQADILPLSRERGHKLSIVLIGFGQLGEQLLSWGLQSNIFDPSQQISYHIYGEATTFPALHHELFRISDRVVFHDPDWSRDPDILQGADRVIVCRQDNQLRTVQELLLALPACRLDILADDPQTLKLLEGQARMHLFCWKEEALKPENIFDEMTLLRAKAINLRYAHLYGGVPETEKNRVKEWEKLDAFTRYSNISAADYHEIRLQMLAAWKNNEPHAALDPEKLELLSELEHIRWCRYHYLNNWRCGIPENGKKKDPLHRIHQDLIPYEQLSEAEKEKDRENIRLMLEIS